MLAKPERNAVNVMDGRALLGTLPADSVPLVIFDPQYRQVLDHMKFGNEGSRQKKRAELPAMNSSDLADFLSYIDYVLKPSGHMVLWIDKFMLGQGLHLNLLEFRNLKIVDILTWDKGRIGMGKRTRRRCEYAVIAQKPPIKCKGVWHTHSLPDVWYEYADNTSLHPHCKPLALTQELIKAMTKRRDLVVDPCAGSYTTMQAARVSGREFLGCDLKAP